MSNGPFNVTHLRQTEPFYVTHLTKGVITTNSTLFYFYLVKNLHLCQTEPFYVTHLTKWVATTNSNLFLFSQKSPFTSN